MRKLLKVVLLPPDWLMAHAQAYADLSHELGLRYLKALRNRWMLWGLSALAFVLALVFGGVAMMLWSTLPPDTAPRAWVLLALPGCALLLSALCAWWASSLRLPPVLQDLQAQMAMDFPVGSPSARGQASTMTPTQRLTVSRARLAQALRDPAWLLLLQRWLENQMPPAPASSQASASKTSSGGIHKEAQ